MQLPSLGAGSIRPNVSFAGSKHWISLLLIVTKSHQFLVFVSMYCFNSILVLYCFNFYIYCDCTFRQLMSLHLLPHGKIEAVFNRLHAQGTDRTLPIERRQRSTLIQLLDYVGTTWIDSTNWSPKD